MVSFEYLYKELCLLILSKASRSNSLSDLFLWPLPRLPKVYMGTAGSDTTSILVSGPCWYSTLIRLAWS